MGTFVVRRQADELPQAGGPIGYAVFAFPIPIGQFTAGKGPDLAPFDLDILAVRITVRIFMESKQQHPAFFVIYGVRLAFFQADKR